MCRVVGFWDFNHQGRYDLARVIDAMRDTMVPGGPDDAGSYHDVANGLALGHRRLSILDLSPRGHQPMASGRGHWITYNGETYNFAALREPMAQREPLVSESDTEVVLRLYAERGPKAVEAMRGMFAFGVWDASARQLFVARDRLGIKPLYYYWHDGLFMFASEPKAFFEHPKFRAELDMESLRSFLRFGYVNCPRSMLQHVRKLAPGHWLRIDANRAITVQRYWDPAKHAMRGPLAGTEEEIRERLLATLIESAQLRTIADVPVGIFLSGGIDSSLVAALVQCHANSRFKTFTIGFDEGGYDEAPFARQVAQHLGTEHIELYCERQDAAAIIEELPDIFSEPFGDSSAIPMLLVSRLARQHVTVALSGDGGDELFFGYNRFERNLRHLRVGAQLDRWGVARVLGSVIEGGRRLPGLRARLGRHYRKVGKVASWLRSVERGRRLGVFRSHCTDDELDELLPRARRPAADDFTLQTWDSLAPIDDASFLMIADLLTYLPEDILTKVDRTTMWVSLEGREPLIDHEVVELALRLPLDMKFAHGEKKLVLKQLLGEYLPRELIDRPKQGFGVPVERWCRDALKDVVERELDSARLRHEGLFSATAVRAIVDEYQQGRLYDFSKLWFLLVFQQWKHRYLS